jgi:hypothetical protein
MTKAKTEKDPSAVETGSASNEDVVTAYFEYIRAQQEAWLDYQRHCSEAHFKRMTRQANAEWKAVSPIYEAQGRLMKTGDAVTQNPDKWQDYQEAYQQQVKAQSEYLQNKEYQEELKAAYLDYVEAEREAAKKAQKRSLDAYKTYLDALKRE